MSYTPDDKHKPQSGDLFVAQNNPLNDSRVVATYSILIPAYRCNGGIGCYFSIF